MAAAAFVPNNEKDKQSAIMPKFVFIFVAPTHTSTSISKPRVHMYGC